LDALLDALLENLFLREKKKKKKKRLCVCEWGDQQRLTHNIGGPVRPTLHHRRDGECAKENKKA
jgi:hypothetical protein